ncbi:flagellar hook-length control protein FliK [Neptunomonas sp. XY-337]|uniref:flagellar hook-length control protein FliK n=1 Tax=Neptunomonas sp. XY-337 TaxID=2561897 RepID=UPI0010AB168A|nr:flagellar hook-length control protein FliK [Neptunomonas sp. XY-337]
MTPQLNQISSLLQLSSGQGGQTFNQLLLGAGGAQGATPQFGQIMSQLGFAPNAVTPEALAELKSQLVGGNLLPEGGELLPQAAPLSADVAPEEGATLPLSEELLAAIAAFAAQLERSGEQPSRPSSPVTDGVVQTAVADSSSQGVSPTTQVPSSQSSESAKDSAVTGPQAQDVRRTVETAGRGSDEQSVTPQEPDLSKDVPVLPATRAIEPKGQPIQASADQLQPDKKPAPIAAATVAPTPTTAKVAPDQAEPSIRAEVSVESPVAQERDVVDTAPKSAPSAQTTEQASTAPAKQDIAQNTEPDTRGDESAVHEQGTAAEAQAAKSPVNETASVAGTSAPQSVVATPLPPREAGRESGKDASRTERSQTDRVNVASSATAQQDVVAKPTTDNRPEQSIHRPTQSGIINNQPQGPQNTAAPELLVAERESTSAAKTAEPASKDTGLSKVLESFTLGSSHQPTLVRPSAEVQARMPQGMLPTHPQWQQAVSERVVWAAGQQVQTATIQLDPPELGSLQVKLQVTQEGVNVSFTSPHANVRDAVEQSIPRLREMMAEQGLDLAESSVGDQSSSQDRGAQNGESGGQYVEGGSGAPDTGQNAPMNRAQNLNLVDYYA